MCLRKGGRLLVKVLAQVSVHASGMEAPPGRPESCRLVMLGAVDVPRAMDQRGKRGRNGAFVFGVSEDDDV